MPFFGALTQPQPLPAVGSAIERAVMDWKVVADGTAFHMAKDVAAFANHLGGTILIGAKETDNQLTTYVGMTEQAAGNVRDKFSKAVEQKCEPRPQIDFAQYMHPTEATKRIVAINVWPSLLLVGVRVSANKAVENYGGDSFVFPVRSGTDATYLTPSQLAMYMTPQVRRIAVLLSKIPKNTQIQITETARNHQYNGRIQDVIEEENIVTFTSPEGSRQPSIPLDCITSVFESWDPSPGRAFWRLLVNYSR